MGKYETFYWPRKFSKKVTNLLLLLKSYLVNLLMLTLETIITINAFVLISYETAAHFRNKAYMARE